MPELASVPPPRPRRPPPPPEPAATPGRKRFIKFAVIAAILFAAATAGAIGKRLVGNYPNDSKEEAATKINQGLLKGLSSVKFSVAVDDTTTLTHARVDGVVSSYFYRVDDTKINIPQNFITLMRQSVIENTCKSQMVGVMKAGARMKYNYTDTKNRNLGALMDQLRDTERALSRIEKGPAQSRALLLCTIT